MTATDIEALHALAATAVRAVAAQHLPGVGQPRPLDGYSNLLLKVEPFPLVARVVTAEMARVRTGPTWLGREVALGRYLARRNAATVPPATLLPAGPHEVDGIAFTFWQYLEIGPIPPTPRETGAALRSLHESLMGCPVALPAMAVIDETDRMLARPDARTKLGPMHSATIDAVAAQIRLALAERRLHGRALHGDAHHGNLWRVGERLVWGDLEDAQMGPIEWDLAAMTASSVVLGTGGAAADALASYGAPFDAALLRVMIKARTLQGLAWAFVGLPDPMASPRLQSRLRWLAAQAA